MNLASEVELKANLLMEGMRIEEEALEGVGTKYLENINFIFDFNHNKLNPQFKMPVDCKLPLGTRPQVRINARSPYLVRKENGTLVLEREGKFVTTLEWNLRPKFYDKLTSDGIEMQKIAQWRGKCSLVACFSNFCSFWKTDEQCRFCNINAAKEYSPVLPFKKPDQIGEVAAAAIKEKGVCHIVLSGGTLPESRGTDICIDIVKSIKRHTGMEDRRFACANLPALEDLKELERLHEAGFINVLIDLECWNPHIFQAICPGKSGRFGQEKFLKTLEYAVSVFGRGRVGSAFVFGLEERNNYLEAAECLAKMGVYIFPVPWIPNPGSKLEGHRAPYAEWILEVQDKIIDIMIEYLPEALNEDFRTAKDYVHVCYECSNDTIWTDVLRIKAEEREANKKCN